MGQKVNPHGLRVGVIKDWDSRWYAREDKVGDLVVEDYNLRKYLKNKLYAAGVSKIEIERVKGMVKININCSRPGVVIGKAGADIENLRKEMEAFAHVQYVRMSPRKVKLVCDMIRGKDVKTAAAYLSQTSKAACEPMAKLLKSAVANAEHNNGMNADNLYVSTVIANPGPVLKRGRIASRRGFVRIMKRTTHITIGVSEKA